MHWSKELQWHYSYITQLKRETFKSSCNLSQYMCAITRSQQHTNVEDNVRKLKILSLNCWQSGPIFITTIPCISCFTYIPKDLLLVTLD